MMELSPKRPSPLWFWGPNSIIVVYMDPLGGIHQQTQGFPLPCLDSPGLVPEQLDLGEELLDGADSILAGEICN